MVGASTPVAAAAAVAASSNAAAFRASCSILSAAALLNSNGARTAGKAPTIAPLFSSFFPSFRHMSAKKVSFSLSQSNQRPFLWSRKERPLLQLRAFGHHGMQSRLFSAAAAAEDEKVIEVPSMGDSITEGTLNQWKKNVGDYVQEGDLIAVVDTDKVSVDITSPHSGRLLYVAAATGDTVEVGKPLCTLDLSATPSSTPTTTAIPTTTTATTITTTAGEPQAAAAAPEQDQQRKQEKPREKKQEKSEEKPQKSEKQSSPPSVRTAQPASTPSLVSFSSDEKRVPMSRMRQRIAERLKGAQNTAAMLTTFNECDMGNLMALRSEMNSIFQEVHGVKMGFVSAFMLAACCAIKKIPEVNAFLDGKDIVYKSHVDISVAVATPTGLMVPVVRCCEQKSWAELEKELAALASRARKGQIALEDMAGGTFTISNGGVYGSMMGTPILNPPQASILGMHAVTKRAVVKDDQIVIRPMMYLALTYDHRLIDGREAVTFLRLIRDYVEDPRKMLLDC